MIIHSLKNVRSQIHGGDPFLATPVSYMGKFLTFDRKVVETQFFTKMTAIDFSKEVGGHFALKCFLNRLIGQLVILGHKSQNFTMLTPVCYLRIIFYTRVLRWVQRITKKKFQAQIHPEHPFSDCPNTVKFGQKSTFDRTPFFR